MIVGRLLGAGMAAGLLAGLLAALFARVAVEPSIDAAIAFEALQTAAHGMNDEPEVVSRAVQKGAGLIVAAAVYGAGLGGIFALVFAAVDRRVLRTSPRVGAAWLALAGFVAIALVPALKYPSNPPAVGLADTIGLRTAAFFAMIAVSVAAAAAAVRLAAAGRTRLGSFDAALAAILGYVVVTTLVARALPAIDEVPRAFPASVLWSFRLGSLLTQAVLWTGLGVTFGAAADRLLAPPSR